MRYFIISYHVSEENFKNFTRTLINGLLIHRFFDEPEETINPNIQNLVYTPLQTLAYKFLSITPLTPQEEQDKIDTISAIINESAIQVRCSISIYEELPRII